MRGFILAAGFGTRLQPLTSHLPKALVPFAGTPLLQHALTFLQSAGISTIGINTHYLPESISEFIAEHAPNCPIFNETPEIRGTGGALDFARGFLSYDETFIVANADIVTRFDLRSHVASFEASNDVCRLIGWKPAAAGTIRYNRNSKQYTGTVGKGNGGGVEDECADFFGIALYRREFLSIITADDFSIVPVWQRAVNSGMQVSVAVETEGFWRDLGTPAALAQAHFDVLDGTLSIATAPHCNVDAGKKCCFPSAWGDTKSVVCGTHCWIENPQFLLQPDMSDIIVLRNAEVDPHAVRSGSLYTQWGSIVFNG